MNMLLASPDPVLRDEVAYTAAERWIVRDQVVVPDELQRLLALWSANLDDGLGAAGDDRVFKRSFSALCLSLVAARDVATPFLRADEVQRFFDRLLDYFPRERDLRGFDAARGWMHTPAHTADAFKFLARSRTSPRANLARLLDAVRAKLESSDAVFAWGENDRMAWRCTPPSDGPTPIPGASSRGSRAGCTITRRSGPRARTWTRFALPGSRTPNRFCAAWWRSCRWSSPPTATGEKARAAGVAGRSGPQWPVAPEPRAPSPRSSPPSS